MAITGNGRDWIIKYLVGVLVSAVVFVWLPTLTSNVIANDKDSRQRDIEIREEIHQNQLEQREVLQNITVTLAEIKTDLKYVKRKQKDED